MLFYLFVWLILKLKTVSLLVLLVLFIVKYQVSLVDGTVVGETPEGGVEFYLKDGNIV
jgi:hypothetical protein